MHAIYRSMELPLPRLVLEMSEEEREKRVEEFAGFLKVDDNLFLANGWVNIEVKNQDYPFYSWKAWSSISAKKFSENLEELRKGKVIEFQGALEDELVFYPNSRGLTTKTRIQVTDEGVFVEIQTDEDSQLVARRPIKANNRRKDD